MYFIKVEPYWNVNGIKHLGLLIIGLIKVEPYWNVNLKTARNPSFRLSIKVEPYWNVNFSNEYRECILDKLK